jgi:hypothetical protein
MRGFAGIAALVVAIVATVAGSAAADSTGPIDFEPGSSYTVGDINGQQGWSKTGAYDTRMTGTARG